MKWQTVNSKKVFSNPWITVHEDKVKDHRQKLLSYATVAINTPAAIIVALNQNLEVCLIKQYRYPVNKSYWRLPAGYTDNQDPLVAAKRELLEETGLKSSQWQKLGTLDSATGIGNIPHIAFLALNANKVSRQIDEAENIQAAKFVPLDNALAELAGSGHSLDTETIAALALAKNSL